MIPDWQLPNGVDRGLWDYLHAIDMVAEYDRQVSSSPLAAADMAFCDRAFLLPGKLVDLGCGTGRLCLHFATKGFDCVGVDLSEEMLAKARQNLTPQPPSLGGKGEKAPPPLGEGLGRGLISFHEANITEPSLLEGKSFDYAACLFSTIGMIRGAENRAKVIANAFRLLKPGGRFVLHAHNRFFRGLGWKRVVSQRLQTLFGRADAGDITMPQAYAGAALTLHHFTRREVVGLLEKAGFTVLEVLAIGDDCKAQVRAGIYGWLILAQRSY